MSSRKSLTIIAGLLIAALLIAGCSQDPSSGSVATTGVGAPASENALAARAADNGSEPQRSISVTGNGIASAAPDMATITLGVDTSSKSASTAAEENSTKMNRVVAAVRDMGIPDKDIQTVDYRIFADRVFEDGKPTNEIEYRVTNQVRVTVRDLSIMGDLFGNVITADVNNLGGISFGITDSNALERDARAAAMADAKDRAQQLANGLGVELGAPIQISEYTSGGSPTRAAAGIALEKAFAAPPIAGGEMDVNVQVSVSFAIK